MYKRQPLINQFYNKAQPIDQAVFKDKDGQYYIIYGGWGRCNIAKLKNDFTGLMPLANGEMVQEITPKGYVEGPIMFIRHGKYYLMWSEGGWTNGTYKVASVSYTHLDVYKRQTDAPACVDARNALSVVQVGIHAGFRVQKPCFEQFCRKFGVFLLSRIKIRQPQHLRLRHEFIKMVVVGNAIDFGISVPVAANVGPVSYTHLDVYKRQA